MDEESIGEVTISDETRYWIYTINSKSWATLTEYFETSGELYIPTFREANINKGDVIIVYLKGDGLNNGYIAITQTLNELCSDKNIKIFKDSTVNKYCVELNTLSLLQKPFKLKEVTLYLSDDKNFKSLASYRSKYTAGDLIFLQLPSTLGKKLLIGLYELSDNFEELSIKKQEEKKSKEEEKKKIEEEKSKNKYAVNVRVKQRDRKDLTKFKIKAKDFEIVDNDDSGYESSGSDDEFVSFEKDESDSDGSIIGLTPMVPIMFDPCKNFRWLDECLNDEDFLEEFKKHCRKCRKCKITNNGDKGLEGFIDTAILEYEVAYIEDTGFEDIMNAYYTATNFTLSNSNAKKNFIRLYLIEDDDHIYCRCILIEWGIKSAKFTKAKLKTKKATKKPSKKKNTNKHTA